MEYPTFITSGGSRLLQYPPFSWFAVNETVTVHEFGHQYFQGLLASNEFEQAWLDEGFTSYSETSCMAAIVEDGLVPEIRTSNPWAAKRLEWARRRTPLQIDQWAWDFRTRESTDCQLYEDRARAQDAGRADGSRNLRPCDAIVRRHLAFWSSGGRRFFAAMNAATGEDLGWFFDQAIRGDATVDWGIASVRQRAVAPVEGVQWQQGAWVDAAGQKLLEDEDALDAEMLWVIRLDLVRRGEFIGPVEVLLVFADGSEQRRTWDGRDRWTRFNIEGPERLLSVAVDPDGVWVLEGRRADNYWRDEPDSSAVNKTTWWATAALRFLGLAATPWS